MSAVLRHRGLPFCSGNPLTKPGNATTRNSQPMSWTRHRDDRCLAYSAFSHVYAERVSYQHKYPSKKISYSVLKHLPATASKTFQTPFSTGIVDPTDVNAAGKPIRDRTPAPPSADIVVIGGGILGCSALYHLAKLGITNTVLIEANKVISGSSWTSAGLLWRLSGTDTDVELLRRSRDLYTKLYSETGVDPGWVNNGSLFVASTKERLEEYKRLMTLGRALGVDSHVLTPSDIKKWYPLLFAEDLKGALYCPGSGTVNPATLSDALLTKAKIAGAKVLENCAVIDIKTSSTSLGGEQVHQVVTARGKVTTSCVINATGAWANSITEKLNVTIPLSPVKHAYQLTKPIGGLKNQPNIIDHDASVYFAVNNDSFCLGGFEKNPQFIKKASQDFAFCLYDLISEDFEPLRKAHIHRIPALANATIKTTFCGLECFTPDFKPIMGEDTKVQGFYHCSGFNSAGTALGGGCGEQIAKWVVRGRPDLDMFAYDIRRFNPALLKDRVWAKQKIHEAYYKNFRIAFPVVEPLSGRGRRKSPLHSVLEKNGCVYRECYGWEVPGWFQDEICPVQTYDWYGYYQHDVNKDQKYAETLQKLETFTISPAHEKAMKECKACHNSVGIFDMSYFGKIFLSGVDAERAADYLFTANVNVPPGSSLFTCMLNENGGTEAALFINVLAPGKTLSFEPRSSEVSYCLVVPGRATCQVRAHILKEARRNSWKVTVNDSSDDVGLLSLQGPHSRDLLRTLSKQELSNEEFPLFTHKVLNVAGYKVRAVRTSLVGELGWELHVPKKNTLDIYKALLSKETEFGVVNCGSLALEMLSCEAGHPLWHADIRPDDTPLEAGLDNVCKLDTKTFFLGRDALESQRHTGVRKKLVTLTVNDTNVPLWGGEAIKRDGVYVGVVRRAAYGTRIAKSICHGYVQKTDKSKVDNSFVSDAKFWTVEVMGKEVPAQVYVTSPFVEYSRLLGGSNVELDRKHAGLS